MLKTPREVRDPCTSYVPLLRKNQFTVVRASTQTRVSLGLALGEMVPKRKLESSKAQDTSERITHRIALKSPEDANAEVLPRLKRSYADITCDFS